ncbi:MAG: response regulator, partial [Chloroflexota bacterium]
MSISLQVLCVEDSENDTALIHRVLEKAGYSVTLLRVETLSEMQAALDEHVWDVIISDFTLPQFDAPTALSLVKKNNLDIPFIIVSGQVGEETAVSLLKAGAHDYLYKEHLDRLIPVVKRELD